jgi:hypothetical protein
VKHHHVIVHILTVQMSSWCLRDDIGPTLLLKKEEGLTAAAKKGEFDVDYYLSIHFWQQWGMKIGSLLSLEWSFHYLPQLYLICDDGHFEKRTRKAGPKRQLEELDVYHYRCIIDNNEEWKLEEVYCCHSNPSRIFRTCTLLQFWCSTAQEENAFTAYLIDLSELVVTTRVWQYDELLGIITTRKNIIMITLSSSWSRCCISWMRRKLNT